MKVKKEATNPILKTLIMTKKVKNANDQVKKKKEQNRSYVTKTIGNETTRAPYSNR